VRTHTPTITDRKKKMKKLFACDYFVEKNYISAAQCERWEKKIFENSDIFGPDIHPEYGQMAAYYGMIESGLNESYYRYAEKHNKYLLKEFHEVKEMIEDIGSKILHRSGIKPGSIPLVPRDK